MRYYSVTALGLNRLDRRFEKAGTGWSFTSLIQASSMRGAEKRFRKDKRFRRTANQNNQHWREVALVIEETPVRDFGNDVLHLVQRPEMPRQRFMKQVRA